MTMACAGASSRSPGVLAVEAGVIVNETQDCTQCLFSGCLCTVPSSPDRFVCVCVCIFFLFFSVILSLQIVFGCFYFKPGQAQLVSRRSFIPKLACLRASSWVGPLMSVGFKCTEESVGNRCFSSSAVLGAAECHEEQGHLVQNP